MSKPKSALRQIVGFVLLGVLAITLFLIFQWAQETLIPKSSTGSESFVYPPPPDKIRPTDTFDAYPPPSLEPTYSALPTSTVLYYLEPESTVMPGPPPGWPTDQPWPPTRTKNSPTPTVPPSPFPTPAISQTSAGERPDSLSELWFPYYPKPDTQPKLWAVDLDEQNQRWGTSELPVDLFIPIPQKGFEPGPILMDLHISPDAKWLVADFAYRGSQLVNISSGTTKEDELASSWRFVDWVPEHQGMLVYREMEFQVFDLPSSMFQSIEIFPQGDEQTSGKISWDSVAFAPGGNMRADAIVYPAYFGVRDTDLLEVGVWDSVSNLRKPLIQFEGEKHKVNYFVENSLRWSPDGGKLIWIAHLPESKEGDNQLWIANLQTGNSKVLGALGAPAEYNQPAIWSPDGKFIVALKTESSKDGKAAANNVFLIDPETGENRQITFFSKRKLSHLQWSPNGKWLTFTISLGDYGEIWAVDIEGNQPFPIAGPTLPDAPYSWVP